MSTYPTSTVSASRPGRGHVKKQTLKVFVSYCNPEEASYRNLMLAWDVNEGVGLNFELSSPRHEIDSTNSRVIQAKLRELMQGADCLLVIVGPTTRSSNWVNWEIQAAQGCSIPVIAVKLARALSGPPSLYRAGTKFINTFNQAQILSALRQI